MELRHLTYFVALAEEGSFRRAAARLFVTQPALSRQIRDLERSVGEPLFRRTSRGVCLTDAGARLLPPAREAVEAFRRAVAPGRAAGPPAVPDTVLRVGALFADVAAELGPPLLAAARAALPRTRVSVHLLAHPGHRAALERGEVDALVGAGPPPPGAVVTTLFLEHRALLVRRDADRLDLDGMTAADAAARPLVFDPSNPADWMAGQLFTEVRPLREARLVPVHAAGGLEVLAEVLRGAGAAAVVRRFARGILPPEVAVVPVHGVPPLPVWVAVGAGAPEHVVRFADLAGRLAAQLRHLVPDSEAPGAGAPGTSPPSGPGQVRPPSPVPS